MEITLGLDDTDSLRGGCTTHLAWRLQMALAGLARPTEAPLLLRLNPTIPYRTRGNGAVALRLETDDPHGVLEAAMQMVEEEAWMEDPRTHPGLVLLPRPPTPAQRETAGRAITGVVELEEARHAINGAPHRGWKKERGLVGALAAASYAWTGLPDPTYELLAYRQPDRWGTPRDIDPQSVRDADHATYPETWHTLDHADGRILFAPHTPCPILCGVRGNTPGAVARAMGMLRTEAPGGMQLFRTNQGTDMHILPSPIAGVRPRGSYRTEGQVAEKPRTRRGGHTSFPLEDETGKLLCWAFEPTKQFRRVVRSLQPGDRVAAQGSCLRPGSLNLEKLEVLALAETRANPRCPACERSMPSLGRGQGYRCRRCGLRSPGAASPRDIEPGLYEVPPRARRHLHMPLVRSGRADAHPLS